MSVGPGRRKNHREETDCPKRVKVRVGRKGASEGHSKLPQAQVEGIKLPRHCGVRQKKPISTLNLNQTERAFRENVFCFQILTNLKVNRENKSCGEPKADLNNLSFIRDAPLRNFLNIIFVFY